MIYSSYIFPISEKPLYEPHNSLSVCELLKDLLGYLAYCSSAAIFKSCKHLEDAMNKDYMNTRENRDY